MGGEHHLGSVGVSLSSGFTRLMYVSKASWPMSAGELEDLLTGARFRNRRHGVTGVLLYESGHFAQVLEGPTAVVERLMKNIAKDGRHREFQIISRSEVEGRYFVGWDMDWRELANYTDAGHQELRRLLQERSIGDRDVVYAALSTFLTELAKTAMPDAPPRKRWFW